jgi:uncharacterized protein with von Willebrand factor type A (vWA) domain
MSTTRQQKPTAPQLPKINPVKEVKDGRDTTIGVPKWDRYMAAKEAEAGGTFSAALVAHERSTAWAAFARETFAKLYDSGLQRELKDEDRPLGSDWVSKLHESAEALPEWRALRERSRRDAWACGVASGEALNVIASTVTPPETDPQALQDELDFVRSLVQGSDGQTSPRHLKRMASLQRQIQDANEEHARAGQMLQARGAGLRSAMRAAAKKAQDTINEMDDAMATLGAGDGCGATSRVNAPPQAVRSALQKNAKLRKILKLAGRMKSAAIAKQRSKATPGREELCDVTAGDDIARLIPSELVNLAEAETEAVLFRRITERAAMTYELRGKVTVAEGPIILVVDESGSMSGARDEWAKSVAFALMEIAARQNRAFAYVHFDYQVSRVDEFPNPRSVGLKELEELCSYFHGGGTHIATALQRAASMLEGKVGERAANNTKPWKRADVILITDGDDGDTHGQKAAIERIRKTNGHLYSIFIDAYMDKKSSSPLVKMADEMMFITNQDIASGDPSKLGTMFSM